MGLFDFFKKKSSPSKPTAKSEPQKSPGVYNRRVKVVNSQSKNSDGSSRQKILADIYRKKEPFNKVLNVEMAGMEADGKITYLVSVNGMCVGEVEEGLTEFITTNRERLLGISDFRVSWTSPLEEVVGEELDNMDELPEDFDERKYYERRIKDKDRDYTARMKIKVQSKK